MERWKMPSAKNVGKGGKDRRPRAGSRKNAEIRKKKEEQKKKNKHKKEQKSGGQK